MKRVFLPVFITSVAWYTKVAGSNKSLDKETPGGHVPPPVPPETYRWEELRRQRALGGYPWSHLDKPPLGSRDHLNDHEYEPINPRPQPVATPAGVAHKDADMEVDAATSSPKRRDSEASSLGSGDPNFIRISLHDDDVDKDALKDEAEGGEEKQLTPQELQTRMEERYFAATPTTTESRTDCDVNTSQLDSSGLEDLPLKRGSRKKKQLEEGEAPTRGFQQRIRSQAGRLRAKLRSMKMPERPKFNLPDRPKFNMPERPKFNLPERPKFNMPERPKFNLPDRPKFSMPERPKFNFPERPKFNMPSMPSFSRPAKTAKTTSSLRRPLRDRATNPSTESNASSTKKSNLFDFDFRTYPRIFDRSRRKYATSSPKSTPRSQTPPPDMGSSIKPVMPRKKGPVGSRWVHRFSDIKYADDEENKPDTELRYQRGDSPDVRVIRLRDSTDEDREEREEIEELEAREAREEREDVLRRRRMQGYDTEVRDAVEELERQKQERDSFHTDSTSAFHDKDYGYAVTIVENKTPLKEESFPDSDKEQRSSGSSSDRHRAGVLEEIDSDEFFLREKGISREDVDVERYLTSEIRDAFRSPENALSKMDDKYYYDDEEEDGSERREFAGEADIEPVPPVRSKSLQKPKRKAKKAPLTPEEDTTNFFNTFPPARPKRNRRYNEEPSREEALIEEEPELAQPTFLITQPTEVSFEEERNYRNKMEEDEWLDEEVVEVTPPTAPRRVRRSRQEQAPASSYRSENVPEAYRNGLTNGHHDGDDETWTDEHEVDGKNVRQEIFAQYMESDYIIPQAPESPPVAPKRGRRHASRGPSVHSLADEDATSRGADSLPSEREPQEFVVSHAVHEPEEFPRIGTVKLQDIDLGESGGYATVEKIYPSKPARASRPKPPRPPPPARKKRFFSLPRRTHAPPTRPLRNYSTLGPSRPARRERSQRQGRADPDDDYSRSTHEDAHGSNRDLSSGVVIEKMKGRPLPAPPRPPRKGRDTREGSTEHGGEEEDVSEPVLLPEVGSALGALNDNVFYQQKEGGEQVTFASAETRRSAEALSRLRDDQQTFLATDYLDMEVEEVSIATQTDPLPDDFCMEVEDEEPKPRADACTETPEPNVRRTSQTGGDTATTSSSEDRTSETMTAKTTVVEEVQRVAVISQAHEEPPQLPPRTVEPVPNPEIVQEPVQEPAPAVIQTTPRVETVPALGPSAVVSKPASVVQVSEPVLASATSEPPAQVTQAAQEATPASQPAVVQAGPSTAEPPPPMHTTTIIERQVPVYIMPDEHTIIELKAQRLQVSELDVEKLNVGEISAHKILVSDIDGVSMQVAELTSKSGKLMVNGIELPPGFLQEIYDAFPRPSVVQTEPEPVAVPPPPPPTPTVVSPQAMPVFPPPPLATAEPAAQSVQPPTVPPLPMHIPIEQMYSFIPTAMRVPRSRHQDEMDSEEEMLSFVPSSHRRRRHHAPKHVTRYSSDEEEEVVSFVPRRQARGEASTSSEPSVMELGRQLVTAVQGSSLRAMRSMLQYTATQFEGEDKRRELQTAICILLVLVAGLILMGYGTGKTLHHHHWDYFNPPNN